LKKTYVSLIFFNILDGKIKKSMGFKNFEFSVIFGKNIGNNTSFILN